MAGANPFPGMNPYLERRWGDVHTRLISYAADALQAALPPDLRARLEERVFIESSDGPEKSFYPDVAVSVKHMVFKEEPAGGVAVAEPIVFFAPDVEITEPYLDIVDADSGGRVVTTIEVLSRSNKRPGPGRVLYKEKQKACLAGGVNLVEIDLLRAGEATTLVRSEMLRRGRHEPYHVSVWRATRPIQYECYPMALRERLPIIRIPLRTDDADVTLDLQKLVNLAYERGRHDDLNYREPLDPPLTGDDSEWAGRVVAKT